MKVTGNANVAYNCITSTSKSIDNIEFYKLQLTNVSVCSKNRRLVLSFCRKVANYTLQIRRKYAFKIVLHVFNVRVRCNYPHLKPFSRFYDIKLAWTSFA